LLSSKSVPSFAKALSFQLQPSAARHSRFGVRRSPTAFCSNGGFVPDSCKARSFVIMQIRGFVFQCFQLFSRQLARYPVPFTIPPAVFRQLASPLLLETVASFPIPARADPLLSSKSVASFFKSSPLSTFSHHLFTLSLFLGTLFPVTSLHLCPLYALPGLSPQVSVREVIARTNFSGQPAPCCKIINELLQNDSFAMK
jgi:hypothetical protein